MIMESFRYINWETEKPMAPHSSTLAWKIPWTEEPGRLKSMGLHRVGHDWRDSAAAAATKKSIYIYMLLYDWALIESILTLKYFNLLVYKFNEKMEKWRYYWTFNQIAYLKRHTFLKNPLVLIIIMNVIELRY